MLLLHIPQALKLQPGPKPWSYDSLQYVMLMQSGVLLPHAAVAAAAAIVRWHKECRQVNNKLCLGSD